MMNKRTISIVSVGVFALSALTVGGLALESDGASATSPPPPPTITWTATSDRWTVPAGTPVTFTFTALSNGRTWDDAQLFGGVSNSVMAPNLSGDCTIGITSTDQQATAPADGESFCDMPAFPDGGTHFAWHETVYPKAAGNVQGRACIVYYPTVNAQPIQSCSTLLTVHAVTGSGFSQYPSNWTPGT